MKHSSVSPCSRRVNNGQNSSILDLNATSHFCFMEFQKNLLVVKSEMVRILGMCKAGVSSPIGALISMLLDRYTRISGGGIYMVLHRV
jgi:hypothetical protein